jgi:hypothetical protein
MTMACSALALGLLLTAPAHAATLISPPLVAEGENFFDCYLVNVSKKSRSVLIEVFSREGAVVESVETTLGPGEEDVARATSELLPRYCKFTVQGDKQHFRGSVLVRQPGVGSISALPAN